MLNQKKGNFVITINQTFPLNWTRPFQAFSSWKKTFLEYEDSFSSTTQDSSKFLIKFWRTQEYKKELCGAGKA